MRDREDHPRVLASGNAFPWMEAGGHKKGGPPFIATSTSINTTRHRFLSFSVSLILAQV